MKLWVLRPIEKWKPWYDSAFGFVVRASTESDARLAADSESGDEGHVWSDAAKTTCIELSIDGPEGVIIRDFASA